MTKNTLTDEEVALLNTKTGLYSLFRRKDLNLIDSLNEVKQVLTFKQKQEELVKLQNWVIKTDQKVVIIFEGRDAAGKGGAIRRITQHINPRHYRTVALNIPTEDERKQWFFQRYIGHLPNPGEMVFFDRSWYNRAMVEPVNGFCTNKEYKSFMSQVNDFEKMLTQSDIYLIKLYFSITKKEQALRFEDIKSDPLKRWKMSSVDEKAQKLWDSYTRYKNKMLKETHTDFAPWQIIDANEEYNALIHSLSHILSTIPYPRKSK